MFSWDDDPDLNITPLVDVMIDVVLSSDKSISIDKKSEYKLDTFADDFTLFSKDIDRQSEIYIYADEQLPYKDVMRMLGVIKQAGFANVSLMTK
ncbi:MAG: biopolymer transporter ExbD [Sulfurovaceae bacterium]